MMDVVCKDVASLNGSIKKVVEIMHVHVAVAETSSRCNMEISNDLIDADPAFDPATLLSLRIQSLPIMFTLALLDILTSPESP